MASGGWSVQGALGSLACRCNEIRGPSPSATDGSAGGRRGVAGCRLVEQNANRHDVRAAPDGDGILVSCTCGWQAWSPTSAAPVSLLAAEQQIGGKHLAEMQAPIPPRGEVFWAFGICVWAPC